MTETECILKELREVKKELSEVKRENREVKKILIEQAEKSEFPINEQVAADFLDVSRPTMGKYVKVGKLDGTFTINKLGNRMYYRSRLAPFRSFKPQ